MRLFHALGVLCVSFMSGISFPTYAAGYQLGEGYNIGMLNVSGYSKLMLEVPNRGETKLILDDLSLFLSGRFNRYINPFIEFELTKMPIFIQGTGVLQGKSARFVLERAYNDIYLSEAFTLRVGKMLSPVGEWNTVHAAPLVWTTTRPLTTYYNFSEFASGISFLYNDAEGVLPDVQVYYQPSDEFFREPKGVKPFQYRNVSGINVAFTDDLQKRFGISMQYAKNTDYDENQLLTGIDGRFIVGSFRFESQMTYTWITEKNNLPHSHEQEWGGYLQSVYAISDEWSLVSRAEIFQSRYKKKTSDNILYGVVYRPVPAISFKAEYIETFGAQLNISRGFYASMAVLF